MGSFDIDRAALDEAFRMGESRMAVLLDGEAPKAVPEPVLAAKPAAQAQEAGPGFWSRLGSGISSAASRAAELVEQAAARVELTPGPISGARANAAAQVAPPPREPRYGMILAWAAVALAAIVYVMDRK
jgi:hypothetical protein